MWFKTFMEANMEMLSRPENKMESLLPRSLPVPPEWHGRQVLLKDGRWTTVKSRTLSLITDDQETVRAVAMAAFRATQKQYAGNSGQFPAVNANPIASRARMGYCMWRDA
jgi:hypothetical protein